MATFKIKSDFEITEVLEDEIPVKRIFFTLALLDSVGREIHSERISVLITDNVNAVAGKIQGVVKAKFPSDEITNVEGFITQAVADLNG